MATKFRPRALGALMDEYERAALDLIKMLQRLNGQSFIQIMDVETADADCKSIQTIMNHVVNSGYGYANYVKELFAEEVPEKKETGILETAASSVTALNAMLKYTENTLSDKWDLPYELYEKKSIVTRWGATYDVEQILEHAIVHILRHRRQIEKFIQIMK